jgi:protein-L-isoaspartate(D-aspartate) O-methyltransferase
VITTKRLFQIDSTEKPTSPYFQQNLDRVTKAHDFTTSSTHYLSDTMVERSREQLLVNLRIQGIYNLRVLEAIRAIPRERFIDEALASHAYANHPLPIGHGQTISQPFIVARMTEVLLNHARMDTVLEIGSGCGYQTAVLARLVNKVYSVERIKRLYKSAGYNLHSLGLHNVRLKHGDGYEGWSEHAPYQGIMVTAAPETIPTDLLHQLAIGGCMIIPVGPHRGQQSLLKIIRTRTHYEQHTLEAVNFVPLKQGIS